MKIYITAKFKGLDNKDEIEKLCKLVKKSWFEDFCFIRDIENYQKTFENPYELMIKAKEEIEKCDALLINYDWAWNWRIVELWIAYAINKKIIIITKKWTQIKETIKWVSNLIIEYNNLEDIIKPLWKFLENN